MGLFENLAQLFLFKHKSSSSEGEIQQDSPKAVLDCINDQISPLTALE